MIEADIRGKLRPDGSNAHSRSEDLLTSTVFGLLRYFAAAEAIIPLMGRVRQITLVDDQLAVQRGVNGNQEWLDLRGAISCDIDFWPSFGHYGQPDILLTFRDAKRMPIHLVVVEAKLHSPKSDASQADARDGEFIDETSIEADPDAASWHPDQLVRYWQGVLRNHSGCSPADCSVVYLTPHAAPPVRDLTDSLKLCRSMRLGWMSWHDIWHVSQPLAQQPAPSLAAVDLCRLLANRGFKALDAFKMRVPIIPSGTGFWRTTRWFNSLQLPRTCTAAHFWKKP